MEKLRQKPLLPGQHSFQRRRAFMTTFPIEKWMTIKKIPYRYGIFKGLSQYMREADFQKNSAPLSSINTCRVSLILAGNISLDSTIALSLTKVFLKKLSNSFNLTQQSLHDGFILLQNKLVSPANQVIFFFRPGSYFSEQLHTILV